jgi:glycosyltransferase involved in cell wall biosynthesis
VPAPRPLKIAVVVQRYGADISGGAELHARYIAERLARHVDVEVLSTCARDYITWKNELPSGDDTVNGIRVRRFPVAHPRNTDDFGRRSRRVFNETHSLADELGWIDSEGPTSPALVQHLRQSAADYDYVVLFSFRYYHAWHGARAVPDRAVLVPTAERDPAVGLAIFQPVFRGVRAIMHNSLEERALIEHVSGRRGPSVVVGVGSEIPERTDPSRFRRTFGVSRPFALYIGRIDENKGCRELFSFFTRYAAGSPQALDLLLIGSKVLEIPAHPRIRHLGFVSDADKFDALAAADVLIMPSPYESLSMVTLEAWALGRPVLVNGRCDVLRGQAIRSNAGLYYETFHEFAEALRALEATGPLGAALGQNGRAYFREHYTWPVIERKYLDMFERLRSEPVPAMEPLPGWFARRRRDVPPARAVVDAAPSAPVRA